MLLVVRAADGAAYPLYRSDLQDITTWVSIRVQMIFACTDDEFALLQTR